MQKVRVAACFRTLSNELSNSISRDEDLSTIRHGAVWRNGVICSCKLVCWPTTTTTMMIVSRFVDFLDGQRMMPLGAIRRFPRRRSGIQDRWRWQKHHRQRLTPWPQNWKIRSPSRKKKERKQFWFLMPKFLQENQCVNQHRCTYEVEQKSQN